MCGLSCLGVVAVVLCCGCAVPGSKVSVAVGIGLIDLVWMNWSTLPLPYINMHLNVGKVVWRCFTTAAKPTGFVWRPGSRESYQYISESLATSNTVPTWSILETCKG